MTFPAVNSSATGVTGAGSNVTAQVCNLPPTVNAGELLLVVYGGDANGARTATIPSPWVELLDYDGSAGPMLYIGGKIADGTEGGGTVTITTSGVERGAYWTGAIGNWHGTTMAEVAAGVEGTGTAANPGNLTPSWGSADTLWIACAAADVGSTTFTAAPANYTGLVNVEEGSAGGASVAVAFRDLAAASDDPGTFTNDSEQWAASVIAIRPAAGATYSGSFTGDAYIQKLGIGGSLTADAYIRKTDIAGSFTADAYLLKTDISGSFTADAYVLKVDIGGSFTADAYIQIGR